MSWGIPEWKLALDVFWKNSSIFPKCPLVWKNSSYFFKMSVVLKKILLIFSKSWFVMKKILLIFSTWFCYCFESLLLFWKHRYVRLRICGFWRCSERWQSIAMSVREESLCIGWQRLAGLAAAGRKINNFEERLWYSWITLSPNFWLLSDFRWSQIVRKLGNSASNLSISKHLVHYERKVLTLERCLMTQDARECSTKLSFLDEDVALLGDFFVQSVARTTLTACFMVLVCLC